MNEKIKQLIEQAGIESYPAKLLVNTDEEGKVSSKWEIPLEKFAELIVRECSEIADKAEPYKASDLIRKHFGVGE